ncbi:hypothetical protein SCHPADRAFT_925497 [Schizopora paradoxa]|uniref:RanBP2-type domain-containing protein n=1 Tax=Schizopora paradoxa TaxID=27342 RepID=A0A0H2S298_9AGAM|nr:hypothetical protein SCHPADRAFT_925497 [Schizopora paradoxa]
MSGVARSNSRRGRTPQSPYARPKPLKKQSSWGMTTIWNFLSAMGLHDRKTNEEEDTEEEGEASQLREDIQEESDMEVQEVLSIPERISERYQQATPSPIRVAQAASPPPAAPGSDSNLPPVTPGRSPAKEKMTEFLQKKRQDGSLSDVELAGMLSLLEKASEETVKPEPFRFSATPTTPARSPQPEGFSTPSPVRQLGADRSHNPSSLPVFTNNTASTPRGSPRKQLSRNPNGEYRWVGGGSARSSHSPSRRTTPRKGSPSKADGKRRRVDDSVESPISQFSSSSAVQPSSSSSDKEPANGLSKASTSQTTPQRIPRPVLRPKTAPVHPSPLRQVINGASPPGSPPSVTRNAGSPQKTPSRAAAVFTEIIEKVTPPPKPDVSNPYQTASPVKPLAKPKERRKMTEARAKEAEKAKEKDVQKEDLPSPKTIIEATIPKGAKRSRPPPDVRKTPVAKSLSPESRLFGPRDDFDTTMDSMEVEEPKDSDEQNTPTKRQRTVEIEEVDDDVEMNISADKYEVYEPSEFSTQRQPPTTTPSSASNTQSPGSATTPSPTNVFPPSVKSMPFVKSSLPTQPSKLRASFTAEEDEPEEIKLPSKKPEVPKINGFIGKSPKDITMKMDAKALPTFVFQISAAVIDPKYLDASAVAKSKPLSALPTFDLSKPIASTSKSSSTSLASAPPVLTTAAAAQKCSDAWECSTCMLKNPASVTDRCTVCEAPRQDSTPVPASTTSTNGATSVVTTAAAASKGTDTWTCSLCMLKNPASATEACTICEAPRAGASKQSTTSAAPSAPASTVFTTAAAAQKSQDAWTCSLCMLKNPASATDKCTVCENPRS